MVKKTIILLVAQEGYQPIEYGVAHEILASTGIKVLTASNKAGVATAKDASSTIAELGFEDINPSIIDGLFLIGGPGALESLDNELVHTLLQQIKALNKPYGAICISPRILAHANVIGGKKATGWDKDEKLEGIFKKHAVTYVKEPVVTDGKVVTASGPEATNSFAHAIIKVLSSL